MSVIEDSQRTVAPASRRRGGPIQGERLVWPQGVQKRYGINVVTRWRWERQGKLPPRDVFVGGKAVGWRPETLDAAERGPERPEKGARPAKIGRRAA